MKNLKWKRILLLSVKIGIGSSIAIGIAELLQLDYAISAGTVTLLTLMTSKTETFRLALARFASLLVTLIIAWDVFSHFSLEWASYGIVLGLVVLIAEAFGWRTTISVNAVVAAHVVQNREFTLEAIANEFLLVLIGVTIAMILNLYHANWSHKREIIASMRKVEQNLQGILRSMADYLSGEDMKESVWQDIRAEVDHIQGYIDSSNLYQDNTFHTHPAYYISYFQMRLEQCLLLMRLHNEMVRMKSMPSQAKVVADYLYYLSDYVVERNSPEEQIRYLEELIDVLRSEDLPRTQDEFESRALLYHVLMDLGDFLRCKSQFVEGMDDVQRRLYWNAGKKKTA